MHGGEKGRMEGGGGNPSYGVFGVLTKHRIPNAAVRSMAAKGQAGLTGA